MPMQDVAPSAVRIADAIETMICAINLAVSFLLILPPFSYYWGQSPKIKKSRRLIVFRISWGRDYPAAATLGL